MGACDRMHHHLHPKHELKFVCKGASRPYECDGCKELGFHYFFTCEEEYSCNFYLHEHCARPRDSLRHRFFKDCTFRFLEYIGGPDRVCDACGMDVKGFVYHCDGCGNDLHPCCANLESVFEDGDLKLVLQKKMLSRCDCCGVKKLQDVSTWAYVSECNNYTFHISCVKELIRKNVMRRERLADGEGTSTEGSDSDSENDGREIVKRTPMLQLVVGKKKGLASGRFAKIKRTVTIAISFVIAAVLGDPTAIVAGLIANWVAH